MVNSILLFLIYFNMGFNKRYISNDQVIDIFRSQGIEGVEKWYTHKVDALITESGLASDIHDMIHIPNVDQTDQLLISRIFTFPAAGAFFLEVVFCLLSEGLKRRMF